MKTKKKPGKTRKPATAKRGVKNGTDKLVYTRVYTNMKLFDVKVQGVVHGYGTIRIRAEDDHDMDAALDFVAESYEGFKFRPRDRSSKLLACDGMASTLYVSCDCEPEPLDDLDYVDLEVLRGPKGELIVDHDGRLFPSLPRTAKIGKAAKNRRMKAFELLVEGYFPCFGRWLIAVPKDTREDDVQEIIEMIDVQFGGFHFDGDEVFNLPDCVVELDAENVTVVTTALTKPDFVMTRGWRVRGY